MVQVSEERQRISTLQTRIASAERKVQRIAARPNLSTALFASSRDPPTLSKPAPFRSLQEGKVFSDEPMDMQPLSHAAPGADPSMLRDDDGEEPMMLADDEEAFNPRNRQKHRSLFLRTRLADDRTLAPGEDAPPGLGLFPGRRALRSATSVLLFNSKENPYKHYPSKAGRSSNLDEDQEDDGQGRKAGRKSGALGARPATIDQRAGRDISDLDYSFRP